MLIFFSGCMYDSLEPIAINNTLNTEASTLPINIEWKAFKFPDFENREGVSGTFESYSIELKNSSANIIEMLNDAEITIETSSVNISGNVSKTENVLNHFFAYFTPIIVGKVKNISETNALLEITMNGVAQEVIFDVAIIDETNTITFVGKIENLNSYNAAIAFAKLNEVCGVFHEGFVWPDIDLEIVINDYELL